MAGTPTHTARAAAAAAAAATEKQAAAQALLTHNDDSVSHVTSDQHLTVPPTNPHRPFSQTRERLRHFLHPDGRRIHIANSPDEAQDLRRRLERVRSSSSAATAEEDFEVYLSGTPEHLDALRAAQTHNEDRREQLRDRHQTVYEQFSEIHSELDALSREMDRVTTQGVSLEAHFNRYGYNAKIRSYDDEDSPHGSGVTTPRTSMSGERVEVKEGAPERGFATKLVLFKRPVLRQYFHKGILWRGSKSEEVQSFELFVDLLYVGIIQINGDIAAGNPTGESLLRFADGLAVITFTLAYKVWNVMTILISWFETDDIFQRVSVLFLLACLYGYTGNITNAFDSDPEANTFATLVGFHIAARLYMVGYLFLVACLMPTIRGVLGFHIVNTLIGVALYIASIHVPYPMQLAVIFVAMFTDVVGNLAYVFVMMAASKFGETMASLFEFTPAINIEHRTERINAFVTLIFGYTTVAIIFQTTVNGIDAFFGKGVLGLIQAFVFNWLYFEVDSSNLHMHAIRRHRLSAYAWAVAHLPFIMSFVLAGGALARLVVVADTPDADVEHLTEEYRDRSATDIRPGIRWFYCAGLGIALLCMACISMSHIHKDIEGLRLPKRLRLLGRAAVAIVLICLPLATRLNSLKLVGTVTGLVVLVLAMELWATSCSHEKLIGRAQECRYVGRCSKSRLQLLMKGVSDMTIDMLESDKDKHGGHAMEL